MMVRVARLRIARQAAVGERRMFGAVEHQFVLVARGKCGKYGEPRLDRLAAHILAFEGEGYVHWCEGNFEAYEQQRRQRLGIDPDRPRRFRYKRLKA